METPKKPQALVLYQQCEALGLNLMGGGLVDQPHIWLQEIAVVSDTERAFKALQSTGDSRPP